MKHKRPMLLALGASLLVAAVAASACSKDGSRSDAVAGTAGADDTPTAGGPAEDAGGSAGNGGAPDDLAGMGGITSGGSGGAAGEASGGVGGDVPPILERTPRLTHDCSVSYPLATLGVDGWIDGDLASAGGDVFLIRAQNAITDTGGSVISTLDASGELGASTQLESFQTFAGSEPRLAASADGFGAVWWAADEIGGHTSFAEFDAGGGIRTDVHSLDGLATATGVIEIAASENGYALLWASERTLRFGLVDVSGAFDGEPKDLLQSETALWPEALTAFGDGFVAAFTQETDDFEGYLLFLAADGTPRGEPVLLGRSIYLVFSYTDDISLLPLGDQLFVSHKVSTGDRAGAATAVSIARFDASGAPSGPDVLLQAPVLELHNEDAQLVAYGDDIGIIWSQGSVLYLCQGCMPDNHLRFVVVDGDDLTPLSNVVVLDNLQPMGGFVQPRIIRSGDQLVIASTLQYHVNAEGASAGIACRPLE